MCARRSQLSAYDLDEIRMTQTSENMIWEVIESTQIAYLKGKNVRIGELSKIIKNNKN